MSNQNLRLLVSFASSDRLSGTLKKIVGLGQSGSEKLAGMKKEARDLGKELRDVQGELKRSTGNVTGLMNRERDLASRIARTNDEMERQAKLNKINADVATVKRYGADMRSSGTQNIIQGGAIMAPLILAGKRSMEYEKQLALIGQKTDMNEAATKRFGDRILQVANLTGQTGNSMLQSVDFLSGKGVSVKAIDAMLPAIGRFATAWDADVVNASKAAYAGFLSLKVPLDQTARSLEIMAAAGKAGGFEVKDMAEYFPQLTSNLATFGATGLPAVANLSAALQVLEAKTGDGAKAANNLDNLLSFVKSKEGIKNFAKVGIDLPAALKKAEAESRDPLETIIGLVKQATGGDTSKIPQIIGDRQAGAAALALVDSQKKYEQIKAEAFKSVGLTQQEYTRMSKTSDVNYTNMITALDTLTLTAGSKLLPTLTEGVQWITRTISAISDWAAANPETTDTLLKIVMGLGALKLGLGVAQVAFGTIIGPLATFWGWWQKFQVLRDAGKIASAFNAIRNAALFLGKGFMRAGAMMLANPMVLIIMGIVAAIAVVGYLIYKHWDTIKGVFNGALAWLSSLKDEFMSYGKAMMDGLVNGISSKIAAIKDMITGIGGKVAGWFKQVLGIHSPSRVFMAMGGYITEGLARGIDRGSGSPVDAARSMAKGVAGASLASASLAMAATGGGAGSATGAATVHIGSVAITVKAAPGQSPQDIAQAVADEFRKLADSTAAAKRSAFTDDEED